MQINKFLVPKTYLFAIIEKEKKLLIFNIEKEKMKAERKTIEANGIKSFQDIVSKGISKELIA